MREKKNVPASKEKNEARMGKKRKREEQEINGVRERKKHAMNRKNYSKGGRIGSKENRGRK